MSLFRAGSSTRYMRVCGVLSMLICTGAALAQVGASTADIITARQKGLKATGAAFKVLRDESQAGSFDPQKDKAAAADIKLAATQFPNWFPEGSGAESGVKTAAKPEIWSDSDGFKSARDSFVEQAGKFSDLVASGGVDADSVKALGQTCSGCHDKFRVKQP
jgi:cytochrome c556